MPRAGQFVIDKAAVYFVFCYKWRIIEQDQFFFLFQFQTYTKEPKWRTKELLQNFGQSSI